jgi:acetolactate synthase-1/2/3 large subunit
MLYGKTFGTHQGAVRWDRVAEGLGCHGEYVERTEDIAAALQRAKTAKGPAVVCLRTDRDANLAIPTELMLRFAEVYQGPMG